MIRMPPTRMELFSDNGEQIPDLDIPIDPDFDDQNIDYGQYGGFTDGYESGINSAQNHKRKGDFPDGFP